jgi:transcriptional regulator with XRE-family HTH domain
VVYMVYGMPGTKRKVGYMMQGSLADKLRILRAREGLTVTEASERIGINRHTLRSLELGGQEPHYPTLRKIADGYGVPVEELLEEPVPAGKAEAAQVAAASQRSFNHFLAEEQRAVARDLRKKHGIPADAIQWTGPKEIILANQLLEWRHARRVVSWVKEVRNLFQAGRMSLEDAALNFYEAALVLEGIVDAMPIGHANAGARERKETEAARDAYFEYIVVADETFNDMFALKALPPDHFKRLHDTANYGIPRIGFGLLLRGVAVTEEGLEKEADERAKAFRERVA